MNPEANRCVSCPAFAATLQRVVRAVFWLALTSVVPASSAAELPDTIERIKPSIVGIGTFVKLRNPAAIASGTGFAVADGRHVVTNAHVLPKEMDADKKETLVVWTAGNKEPREAQVLAVDKEYDIAILRLSGGALPAMQLADSDKVREGQMLVFTGFPLGLVFGFHPATHRAMVSAIPPMVMQGMTARQLNARMISRIRDAASSVIQLDGTAYPGNSGSPLYDPNTGAVYGIVNMVLVKGTRESAISTPSGITYAIPSNRIADLLREKQLTP